jgi:hypothetical protein
VTAHMAPAGRTPPAQMRELDFLLGRHRCVGRLPADGSPATVMYMHGEPTLDGHYYNVDFSWPGIMAGRWILGWNPLDGEYNVYFISDSGTQGTAASAGWVDGNLAITGDYTVVEKNAHRRLRDVFTRVCDGVFTVHSLVQAEADDAWVCLDVYEARRQDPR